MFDNLIDNLEKTAIHIDTLQKTPSSLQAKSITEYIIWVLKQSDSSLLSIKLLNDLKTPITNAFNHRANSENVITYLNQAIKIIPVPINKTRTKPESAKIIKSLQESASSALEQLEEKNTTIQAELATGKAELEKLNTALEASQKKIDTQAARLDSLVEQAQGSFDEKRTEINKQNANFLTEFKSDLDEVLEVEKSKVVDLIKTQKTQLSSREIAADNHIKKLEELLGLAGDKTLTKDYSKLSTEEGASVFWWSLAAIMFFSMGLIFGGVVVWKFGLPPEMNIPALISRIAIPFSSLVPGLYSASKASGHRKAQIRLRNTGVRLSTLEPFISKFNESDRQTIRKELLDEFFKQKTEVLDKRPIFGFSQKSLIELVKTIKE